VARRVDEYYGFVVRRLAAQGALPRDFSAEIPPAPRPVMEERRGERADATALHAPGAAVDALADDAAVSGPGAGD
jgi:hypothetical protein